MCCAFLALVLLGPRFFGAIWWLWQPERWRLAFDGLIGGGGGALWWLWPILGFVFLPWTTIMFVIVAPTGNIVGWDWLWIGLMVAADVASYGGGAGRKQIPGYEGF